jgi:phosphoglycolate phosphatase-like HAD superfamily hydrolase
VTFVGIISGALVFGVLGVLLATPTIASVRTLLFYIYRKLLDIEPFDTELAPSLVRIPGLIAGRRIEAIVFDLDGTLTEVDWTATGLASRPVPWLDRVLSPQMRGRQMRRLMVLLEGFISFLINQLSRLSNQAYLQRWEPVFDLLRGQPPAAKLHLAAGVRAVLDVLARKYKLVLVTTRRRLEIEEFLVAAGLEHGPFDLVIGREDVRNLLPRGEALLLAASRLSLEPDKILVVSDTDTNLRSARAAEMTSAGVLNGLGMEQDFRYAELVLPSVTGLTEWL